MPGSLEKWLDRRAVLVGIILVHFLCALVFMADLVGDYAELAAGEINLFHFAPEAAATIGLMIGLVIEVQVLKRLLRRQAQMSQGLGVAAGALSVLIDGYFRDWGLTPSEQDVAGFTIKGYSISEIANLRGSAEATVKTHLNAIYRKAGVAGRAQLVSLLVEDLMRAPLVPGGPEATPPRRSSADDGALRD